MALVVTLASCVSPSSQYAIWPLPSWLVIIMPSSCCVLFVALIPCDRM